MPLSGESWLEDLGLFDWIVAGDYKFVWNREMLLYEIGTSM